MRYEPHPYQERAAQWVADHERCCLFLDMGLGKTVATLTAIRRLIDWGEVESALVVAPKKVAESTWAAECAKWDHLRGLRVSLVAGSAQQRRKAMAAEADVYVVSRDNVAWLAGEHGGRYPYDMVVLDELTSFKGRSTARSRALRAATVFTPRVVGLTGTPAPNGLLDLWAQMMCIDRGRRLGRAFTDYRSENFYCVEHNHIVIKAKPKPGAEDRIRDALSDICLTMEAKDYLQLPPLVVRDSLVELAPKGAKMYREMEREMVAEVRAAIDSQEPARAVAANAMAKSGKLAQMAGGAVYAEDGTAAEVDTAKMEALEELAESAAAQGEQLLVFYQYKHELARILKRVPGAKAYEGDADLQAWNEGRRPVLCAHPASTAYGLNMQAGGRYVCWYGLPWSLELYQQANARLYRQGQAKPVVVTRLLARGTVDESIAAGLDSKRDTQASFVAALKSAMKKHGYGTEGL